MLETHAIPNQPAPAIANRCLVCRGETGLSLAGLFDSRFGIARPYNIGVCKACGLEQTLPLPTASELKHLYETYYNFSGEAGTTYTRARQQFFASPLYRLWLKADGDISFHAFRGTERLLDVGCNEGRGLQLYQQNGFAVEGLELNTTAAAVAQRQGFTVHTQLIELFQPTQPYDVVVLSNVLEHSLEPLKMLDHVHRLLRPGGQVWISCPNNQSWLRSLFGPNWINWHVPFHTVHFSAATLRQLLSQAGFTQVQVHNRTPALWVAHSIVAHLFARSGHPTRQLRSPLLIACLILVIRGILFPLLWLGNRFGKGDCLVVTARQG